MLTLRVFTSLLLLRRSLVHVQVYFNVSTFAAELPWLLKAHHYSRQRAPEEPKPSRAAGDGNLYRGYVYIDFLFYSCIIKAQFFEKGAPQRFALPCPHAPQFGLLYSTSPATSLRMTNNSPSEKRVISDHVENFDDVATEGTLDPELLVREARRDEPDLSDVVVKKLIRKIDYRLIPPLAFLYAIALVDRNNLPNARLAGMDQELEISIGKRYTFLVMMFFIPYILFELPANLAMRFIGPAKWLGAIGFAWGAVTIGMGFVHSWDALLACRVFFGAFEAGLFPGSIYLMSCWYTRYEVQTR